MKSGETEFLILGGGISGLVCAIELQAAGKDFILLESTDRVGGRMRTDKVDGFLLDVGFQVYLTSYDQCAPYIEGPVQGLGFKNFAPGAYISDGKTLSYMGDPLRDGSSLIRTLICDKSTLKDKWLMWRLTEVLKKKPDSLIWEEGECTALECIRSLGFSERMLSGFFRPFMGGVFLDSELSVSSRLFKFLLKRFATGYAALPEGGMGSIPESLASRLEPGSIRLWEKAEALGDQWVRTVSGSVYRAKNIVIALDSHGAARLLHQPAPAEGRSTQVYYFSSPSTLLKRPALFLNGSGFGRINHLCFPSQVQPSYAPTNRHLVSVTLVDSGNPNETDVDPGRIRLEASQLLKSDTRDWSFIQSYRVRNALPRTTGLPGPGYRRVGARHWQVGDHLAYPSINGACLSGKMLADALLESAGG